MRVNIRIGVGIPKRVTSILPWKWNGLKNPVSFLTATGPANCSQHESNNINVLYSSLYVFIGRRLMQEHHSDVSSSTPRFQKHSEILSCQKQPCRPASQLKSISIDLQWYRKSTLLKSQYLADVFSYLTMYDPAIKSIDRPHRHGFKTV